MTNQNVVVSDVKGVAISVTVTNQTLFSSSVPKTVGVPGGCITISRNKLLRLEKGGVGGTRMISAAWVDSMRASSPPRIKSNTTTASLSETEDQSSWTVSICSLSMFYIFLDEDFWLTWFVLTLYWKIA